jgi:prephenate dehydrogenase
MAKPAVGVIGGNGAFGRFMISYLKKHTNVVAYSRNLKPGVHQGVRFAALEEVMSQPIVVLSIPVQAQEEFWKANAGKLNPQALVIDVSSVKVKPVKLMQKYLPESVQILATHPLFGPVSGKKGIAGLTMVTWPVRVDDKSYRTAQKFLTDKLKLTLLEIDPDTHDKEMAYVQALTFFIGKALPEHGLPISELKTPTYQHLLNLEEVVRRDTGDLFITIQHENPYADAVRKEFVKRITQIEKDLLSKD